MIRRTLRIGVRLGLLLGITFAVVKTVQLRRASSSAGDPEPWEPITAPRPVDEVGEPIVGAPPQAGPGPLATDVPPAAPLTPSDLDISPGRAGSSNGSSGTGPTNGSAGSPAAPAKKAAKKAAKATKKAAKKAAKASPRRSAWVEPVGGTCPPTHPVKAKLSSLIYHLPGMVAYDRTRANRCYTDAAAAEADGFVRAKR